MGRGKGRLRWDGTGWDGRATGVTRVVFSKKYKEKE